MSQTAGARRADDVPEPVVRPVRPGPLPSGDRWTIPTAPAPSLRADPGHAPSRPVAAPTAWRRFGPEIVVSLVAFTVFGWRVAAPNAWRDELVTLEVARRPAAEILDLVSRVDLVHATYYLLVHAIFGTDPALTPVRLISVLAAILTAVLLVRIGRQLESPGVGLAAGLLYAASPLASRYAQEARPYALTTCAVTAAVLALVAACRRPWQRRRWVAYAAALTAATLFNVLSLLMLGVHALYVLAVAQGRIRRTWALTTGFTLLALSPFVLAGTTQRGQVSWLTSPPLSELARFFTTAFQPWWLAAAVLIAAGLLLVRGTHAAALGLGLAWAVLPPTVLWVVSQAHPLYAIRYVVTALPGTALALAAITPALAGLARDHLAQLGPLLRRVVRRDVRPEILVPALALLPVAALALGGIPAQHGYRNASNGHAERVGDVAAHIAERARPGDAILFVPGEMRIIQLGHPAAFRLTDDIALLKSPEESATIYGVDVTAREVTEAARGRQRIWVVAGPRGLSDQKWSSDPAKVDVLSEFRLESIIRLTPFDVHLYVAPRVR